VSTDKILNIHKKKEINIDQRSYERIFSFRWGIEKKKARVIHLNWSKTNMCNNTIYEIGL